MIRNGLVAILLLCTFCAQAAKPSAADIAACQTGKSQGHTKATEIPFQTLSEEDDYWRGYTAITVEFKGKSIGHAKKGDEEGIAYNRRVYPISQAQPLNMSRAEFDDQIKRGSIGINQASNWYWLKGRQQFVCIATNRSMEKATPILFFLSTGKDKHVYVAVGKERKAYSKHHMALFLTPDAPHAHTVFDGYEAYHNSLPNRVFQDQGIELQPYSLEGDEVVRYGWSGHAAGRPQKIEVREGQLKINGRVLPTKRITAFRDEASHETDLGHGTTAYFSPGWVCVENTPSSASGTAVRHKAVYLIRQTDKKQDAWKLPSLFASCTGIRWQGQLPQFDKAEYRYLDGQDEPLGVVFKEYVIRGHKFVATGGTRSTTFVEPGNVYKFSVRCGHQP